MDTSAPVGSPLLGPPVRTSPLTLGLLRGLFAAQLATAVLQPVLAGLFLTGDVDAITWHGLVGTLLGLLGLLAAVVTLVHVARGYGRWRVVGVATVAFLVTGVQLGIGYAGLVQAHVPLGVAVVTAIVLLNVWAWSPAARRPR